MNFASFGNFQGSNLIRNLDIFAFFKFAIYFFYEKLKFYLVTVIIWVLKVAHSGAVFASSLSEIFRESAVFCRLRFSELIRKAGK